mgnify:CR=1 FL=1
MPPKTFIINRNLHLDADDKVVEESDPAGRKVLGGKGKAFYEEEAKHYGLDESHRLVDEPKEVETVEAEEKPVGEIEVPEELKGKLPEDFPGHAALSEAGINTFAQLRKAGDVTEISGIGPATAAKIAERLAVEPE